MKNKRKPIKDAVTYFEYITDRDGVPDMTVVEIPPVCFAMLLTLMEDAKMQWKQRNKADDALDELVSDMEEELRGFDEVLAFGDALQSCKGTSIDTLPRMFTEGWGHVMVAEVEEGSIAFSLIGESAARKAVAEIEIGYAIKNVREQVLDGRGI